MSPELDTVLVDGRKVAPPAASTYLALHKPTGFLTTRSDPHGRRTVYDLLPANCAHLAPVGRLDYRSEGLLLFTDDGAWANRVTHPRYGGEKQYNVLVYGTLTAQQRAALRAPMTIDGLSAQAGRRSDDGSQRRRHVGLADPYRGAQAADSPDARGDRQTRRAPDPYPHWAGKSGEPRPRAIATAD